MKEKLPIEIYRQLNPKRKVPIRREATITIYKNQALVHFPSVLTFELNLKPNDKFELTVEKGKIPTVICKLKRGRS
jgi:hypothetical protein